MTELYIHLPYDDDNNNLLKPEDFCRLNTYISSEDFCTSHPNPYNISNVSRSIREYQKYKKKAGI